MNTTEMATAPAPTRDEIIAAARALAAVCDGAVSEDQVGYNGADSPIAKSILRSDKPTDRQIRALWNILRKYRGQLEGKGIQYELLVPPEVPAAPAPGAPRQPFVPQQVVARIVWAETQYGRRIVMGTSVYSAEVVARVKTLEKRWFDKEGKNSAGIRNAWLVPDSVDAFDTMIGKLEEVEPPVAFDVAADLKAAMDAARDEKRRAYVASRADSAELEVATKLPLRPFQKAGVRYAMDKGGRALIGDDMGVGKTAQALGFLMAKGAEALPAIVISPANIRGTWVSEIAKFTGYKCQIVTAKTSLKGLRKAGYAAFERPEPGYDITILNYDLLSAETAQTWLKALVKGENAYAHENLVLCGLPAVPLILKAMTKSPSIEVRNRLEKARQAIAALGEAARGMREKRFFRSFVNKIPLAEFLQSGYKTLISDEIHYLKDPKSQRGMSGKAMSDAMLNVIGLTGTPILNRPMEVWNLVNCINPKIFPSSFDFGKRYCNGHKTRFGWDFSGSSNLEELDERLRTTVMIRRMKEQVLKELPPKIRIMMPMALDNLGEYDNDADDPIQKMKLLKKERDEWKAVLAALTPEEQKRYISEHAQKAAEIQKITGYLIDGIEEVKQAAVKAKFEESVKFILDLQESQGKVIVFMSHHEFIDRMVEELQAKKLSVGRIDGRVPMGDRDVIKNAFQEGDTQVLVCGIRAASEGLTLTASHTVVFVELDWNPSRHYQCEDRVYRMGQKVQPTMYYLVAVGTIEEEIARMIDGKREVVNAALGEGHRTVNETGIMESVLESILDKLVA
jgi:SNF2 family DNA or RNA helicase